MKLPHSRWVRARAQPRITATFSLLEQHTRVYLLLHDPVAAICGKYDWCLSIDRFDPVESSSVRYSLRQSCHELMLRPPK